MSKWKTANKYLDYAYDLWNASKPGAASILHSNDKINSVAAAVMSPIQMIGGIAHGASKDTVKAVYGGIGKKESLNYANIAGSAFTAGVGMGVVGGLTHDSAGNPDIAGIPFI